MRRFLFCLGLFATLGCCLAADRAAAQQATIATPRHTVSDSFYEHMGSSWGARGKNWFFQFGPPGNPHGAAPQFGGFNPGANFGAGFGGGGFGGNFLGSFSQGSRRSFTSTTPSVTVQNGFPGFISDTSQTPFVISQIPVVGGFPTVSFVNPAMPVPAYVVPGQSTGHPAVLQALQNADRQPQSPSAGAAAVDVNTDIDADTDRIARSRSSSASQPVPSVAQARRMHQAQQDDRDQEALAFMERGRNAESVGKSSVARIYYQMAARRAAGPLRDEILGRLRNLSQEDGQ